jgi:prevent-host-death family protein
MRAINIHEAKTHLSRLVEEAARGEPFIIAKAGRPMVRVVALPAETPPKLDRMAFFGSLKGQFTVPDDFDSFMAEEIRAMFEDGPLVSEEKAEDPDLPPS